MASSTPSSSTFQSMFISAVANSSIFVKIMGITVIFGYVLSLTNPATAAADLLSILPGNILPPNFAIWSIITYSFIETHIWMVFWDIAVILLYGKLVEPLWGLMETLRFYSIVSVSVALLTTITYLFVYLVTQNTDTLFDNPVNGLAGYVAGFTVVLKQMMPDQVLFNTPFGNLRNKHVSLLTMLAAVIARIGHLVTPPFPILFAWGITVSWVYLRFFQKHDNKTKGDPAEGFSFASFFPDRISPVVAVLSNTLFAILVKLKVCQKIQRKYEISAPTVISVTLPGVETHDAERRRQLALKALNERLNRVATLSWPTMDDGTTVTEGKNGDPENGENIDTMHSKSAELKVEDETASEIQSKSNVSTSSASPTLQESES